MVRIFLFFRDFPGFDGDKVLISIWTFPVMINHQTIDVRIFLEQYAFQLEQWYCCRSDGLFCQRSWTWLVNKFYRDAEVDRLAMGAAGVAKHRSAPGWHRCYSKLYGCLAISHLFNPADDVTAAWQTTHFNFHDIDEAAHEKRNPRLVVPSCR